MMGRLVIHHSFPGPAVHVPRPREAGLVPGLHEAVKVPGLREAIFLTGSSNKLNFIFILSNVSVPLILKYSMLLAPELGLAHLGHVFHQPDADGPMTEVAWWTGLIILLLTEERLRWRHILYPGPLKQSKIVSIFIMRLKIWTFLQLNAWPSSGVCPPLSPASG